MSRLVILEGVDGSGKTTLAKRLHEELGGDDCCHYVHLGPHLQVKKGLARIYVEAMLPALLGHKDVIMDRSWLSELPYGTAYRQGADRLGVEQRRMLERIALRCETRVIYCDPGWDAIERSYKARKGEEYVQSVEKLREIHALYMNAIAGTALPRVLYDYTKTDPPSHRLVSEWSSEPHRLGTETAGDISAQTIIVGESYANLTDADPLYQKPFCAFSGAGCSRWLTQQLEQACVGEDELGWVNADHVDELDSFEFKTRVIALGTIAASACRERLGHQSGVELVELPHPQAWKRFHASEPYPLQEVLK